MSGGFIETKSSRLRREGASEFQEVVYVAHKPKPKQVSPTEMLPQSSKSFSAAPEIDMKKARSEIMKLAMSGMVGREKHLNKRALAISLGAIPDKGRKINYKKLKEKCRKEKELAKLADPEFSSSNQKNLTFSKVPNRKASSRSANIKKKSDILGVYGKVKRKDLQKN